MNTDVIEGPNCFEQAQRKARYGHRDWILWSDRDGSHAALKTKDRLQAVLRPDVNSWTLLLADTGIPMKGYPYLAANLIAQLDLEYGP